MKKIIISILILLSPSVCFGAITALASAHANFLTTSASIDSSTGDLIIITTSSDSGTPAGVSDNKSNTWHALTQITSGSVRTQLFYCFNCNVGTGHTFTVTGSAQSASVQVFKGAQLSPDPFDQQNGTANGVTTTAQPGSITPGANGELVVSGIGINGTYGATLTIDSGFTVADKVDFTGGSNYGNGLAYIVQTTAGAVNPTWTRATAGATATTIASFKAAGGSVAVPVLRIQGTFNILALLNI